MCDVLQVTRSGFYVWKNRRLRMEREALRDALASEIRSIHSEQYLDVYGSPRMHQELLKRGFEVCENTVAAVMKQAEDTVPHEPQRQLLGQRGFRKFLREPEERAGPSNTIRDTGRSSSERFSVDRSFL